MSDVNSFLQLINSIIKEDAMIVTNREFTFKEEKRWIKTSLNNIGKNKLHMLVADYRGELIGNVFITKNDFRQSHVAEYHIGVKKGYRNIGLGTVLSSIIIDIVKKDSDIKILQLNVLINNKNVIRLYKRLGFKKVARLPQRFFTKVNI